MVPATRSGYDEAIGEGLCSVQGRGHGSGFESSVEGADNSNRGTARKIST